MAKHAGRKKGEHYPVVITKRRRKAKKRLSQAQS